MMVDYCVKIQKEYSRLKFEEAMSLLNNLHKQCEDTDIQIELVEDWEDMYEKSGTFSIIVKMPAYETSDPSNICERAKEALDYLDFCIIGR